MINPGKAPIKWVSVSNQSDDHVKYLQSGGDGPKILVFQSFTGRPRGGDLVVGVGRIEEWADQSEPSIFNLVDTGAERL